MYGERKAILTLSYFPKYIKVSYRRQALSCIAPGERTLVPENCAFLGYFAASSGNSLPTFRNKLAVPSSRVRIQGDSSSTSLRKPQSTTVVPFGQKIGWTPELVWKIGWTPELVWKKNIPPVSENKQRFPGRPSRSLIFIISTEPSVCSFLPSFLASLLPSFLPSCVVLIDVFNSKTIYCGCSVFPSIVISQRISKTNLLLYLTGNLSLM